MLTDVIRRPGPRDAGQVVLMTVMEARRAIGTVRRSRVRPADAVRTGEPGRVQVTLILQRRAGRWQVVGLNR